MRREYVARLNHCTDLVGIKKKRNDVIARAECEGISKVAASWIVNRTHYSPRRLNTKLSNKYVNGVEGRLENFFCHCAIVPPHGFARLAIKAVVEMVTLKKGNRKINDTK